MLFKTKKNIVLLFIIETNMNNVIRIRVKKKNVTSVVFLIAN
jgi:hypothetical protein